MNEIYGLWGRKKPGEPWLELASNGRATGNDGCNRMSSTFEVHDDRVVFGPVLSTLMFCTGIHTWLAAASSAVLVNGYLEIFDESGEKIGVLER